jgi:hypothetical protein
LLPSAAIAIALVCAGGWYHQYRELRELRQLQVTDSLGPIQEMLKENAAITRE